MQESRILSYLAGGLMAASGAAALTGDRGLASVLHLAPLLLLGGATLLYLGLRPRSVGWGVITAGSVLTCTLLALDAARRLEPTRLVDTLLAFALFGGGLGILAHAQTRHVPDPSPPDSHPSLDGAAPEDPLPQTDRYSEFPEGATSPIIADGATVALDTKETEGR